MAHSNEIFIVYDDRIYQRKTDAEATEAEI